MLHTVHIPSMRLAIVAILFSSGAGIVAAGDDGLHDAWRELPLIENGKVHPDWVQMGYGGFAVVDDSLRTECSEKGMGLLLYRPEKFGDCQIRVVYRSKDTRSNAGVFVRINDGILDRLRDKHPPVQREANGQLTKESLQNLMDASENGLGPWYAVHHGFEIQILESADRYHRTGAVYSLAPAAAASTKPPTEWKTMIVALKGNLVLVDMEGKRVTTFDPDGEDVPADREWYEPRRDVNRPLAGYIGLQNHDPGDVVYFREISVRPLANASEQTQERDGTRSTQSDTK